MCTATYVPIGESNFVFTTNRDEDPTRNAQHIEVITSKGNKIHFPQDAQAKGSWIACSDKGEFACLLNGAFEPYFKKKEYKMSRGKMVLLSFEYNSPTEFASSFDFENMEPFTLILFSKSEFLELKWDGEKLHQKELSKSKVYLWSSATLYNKGWFEERKLKFNEWVDGQNSISQKNIIHYHASKLLFSMQAVYDLYKGQVFPKEKSIQTTSVSSISTVDSELHLKFSNLLTQEILTSKL